MATVSCPSRTDHEDYFYTLDDTVNILPHGAKERLGHKLSYPAAGHDWKTLADKLGYTCELIQMLSLKAPVNPGMELLEDWGRRECNATLRVLRDKLSRMSRADLVEDLKTIMQNPYDLTAVVYRTDPQGVQVEMCDLEVTVCGRKSLQQALQPRLEALGLGVDQLYLGCSTSQDALSQWDTPAQYFKGAQINLHLHQLNQDLNAVPNVGISGIMTSAMDSEDEDCDSDMELKELDVTADTGTRPQPTWTSMEEQDNPEIRHSLSTNNLAKPTFDSPPCINELNLRLTSAASDDKNYTSEVSYAIHTSGSKEDSASSDHQSVEPSFLLESSSSQSLQAYRQAPSDTYTGPEPPSIYLTLVPGLHPNLPPDDARAVWQVMMKYLGKDGYYLVRPTNQPGCSYAISVIYMKDIKHFRINTTVADGVFFYLSKRGPMFSSVADLLAHYHTNPLPCSNSDYKHLYLTESVPVLK